MDILKDEAERLRALAARPPLRRDDLRKGIKKRLRLKDGIAFHCNCGQQFDADWDMIATEQEEDAAPVYLSTCPACGEKAGPASWYAGILRAWERSLNDPELNERRGKHLENTRGPEQNRIARFNGFISGAYSKCKDPFPNRPGSKWCAGCDIDPDYCRSNPAGACVKAAETYMLRHLSIESGDPAILSQLVALNQAKSDVIFNMMTGELLTKGLSYFKPDMIGGEGGPVMARDESGNPVGMHHVHPLLPYFQKHLALMNQTPADTLTAHRQSRPENEGGLRLDRTPEDEAALHKLAAGQADAMKSLALLIQQSQSGDEHDP